MDSIPISLEFPSDVIRAQVMSYETQNQIDAVVAEHTRIFEETVRQHHLTMALYNARRNSMALINGRLLPELLSEIFMHCMRMSFGYSWIKVAHVCRYWRAVALASPSLFSSIDVVRLKDPGQLDAWLRFSKQALLDVRIAESYGYAWPKIFPEITRIRSLHIYIISKSPVCTTQWPTCPQMISLFWEKEVSFPVQLDDSTPIDFHRTFPNLQSLDVRMKMIQRSCGKYLLPASLRILKITEEHSDHIGTLRDWLLTFEALPALEILELSGIADFAFSTAPVPTIVRLPRLGSLTLTRFGIIPGYSLLQHLSWVHNIRLELDFQASLESAKHLISPFARMLQLRLLSFPPLPLRTGEIYARIAPGLLAFAASTLVQKFRIGGTSGFFTEPREIEVLIDIKHPMESQSISDLPNVAEAFHTACAPVVSEVDHLVIDLAVRGNLELNIGIHKIASGLQNVVSLQYKLCWDHHALYELLSPSATDSIVFPKLNKLWIVWSGVPAGSDIVSTTLIALCSILRARQARQHPLKHLVLDVTECMWHQDAQIMIDIVY
ncbi:unnamed protein product [Somion occarium]|uniref:F-box domain-containing protein n=1 Tax=Somion occarium TaxID=3059160 RepID=A0ABP1DJ13_9APHY